MQKSIIGNIQQNTTYLLDTVLIHRLLLVKSSKSTIMTLVQSPALGHGDPQLVRLLQSQKQSLNGTLQAGRISSVELQTFRFYKLSTISGFLHTYKSFPIPISTLIRKWDVVPTSETVLLVPLRFAVANQHQTIKRLRSSGHTTSKSSKRRIH